MLVAELQGKIKVLPPPYTTPDPTPFLQLTNVGSAGVQQGIYDLALDPELRHQPLLLRLLHARARRTATASRASPPTPRSPARSPGSEFVLYQDPQDANAEHHGGAINFGNDGKIYFTTGEHFHAGSCAGPDQARAARSCASTRTARSRPTTRSTTAPGPNYDSIWALGLRNPYRAYYDAPTGRLLIGDVGGNDLLDRDRGSRHRRAGRQLRLAERRRPDAQSRLHEPRSTPTRTTAATRPSPAASSITAPSSPAATRAATSSPTTRRTGSSA